MSSETNIQSAQESRFNAAHFSEALTNFSAGYKDPNNLDQILEFIAPKVHVPRRFEFKKATNSEAFLSESDDIRAIGSSFKQVEYSGETINERTHNKGLTIRIDHDEIATPDWQERYTQLLIQRLQRNELRRAIQILDAATSPQSLDWSQNANPDADLRKTLISAADQSGIRPNRILFGETAWDLRCSTYENKENVAALRSADLSPSQLADKLLVDNIHVLRTRFQATHNKKEHLLGNSIFAYFAQSESAKDEPSNIKRFVSPTGSNSDFRVYIQEHSKFSDITVEHYSNIVVTSNIGIQKINLK